VDVEQVRLDVYLLFHDLVASGPKVMVEQDMQKESSLEPSAQCNWIQACLQCLVEIVGTALYHMPVNLMSTS
jgi:hypothetical protein